MIFVLTESWVLIFITITILLQHHELTYRALLYLRLHESMAKQIKQQTAIRWPARSKPGRDFESPINWNPFLVEFTEQQKSQKQPSKKADRLLIYFYVLNRVQKSVCFLYCKIKFTSYVNYCWKSSQKKYSFIYFILFLFIFGKIKFTSYGNYCWKSSQKKYLFFWQN